MQSTIAARRLAALAIYRVEERHKVGDATLTDLRDNPTAFFTDVLGAQPYDKQIELIEAVRDYPDVAVLGANSTGKDWTTGRLVLWWLKAYKPAKVVVLGPTHRQVSDIVWRETRMAYHQSSQVLGGKMMPSDPRWELGDDHFAIGFATNDPYNLTGFHSPHLLVIVTEAHAVPQKDIDAIRRLRPHRLILTGNAWASTGEFYDAFTLKSHLWHTIRITAWDSPNVTAGETVIPGLVTQEDIDRDAADWGEDSPMFKAVNKAEFPDTPDDILIPLSYVHQAIARTLEADTSRPVVACDVARHGADRTVVVRRDGPVARILWRESYTDNIMSIANRLARTWEQDKEVSLVVDGVGIGAGVVDRLREMGVPLHDFQGGLPARNDRDFADCNAEAWETMHKAFVEGIIDIEDDRRLMGQLSSRKYRIQSDRKIRLESKEDMRKDGRPSPDEADALAMTFAPVSRGVRYTRL